MSQAGRHPVGLVQGDCREFGSIQSIGQLRTECIMRNGSTFHGDRLLLTKLCPSSR